MICIKSLAALPDLLSGTEDNLRADCVVLHPGPINRGVEIDDEVASSDRSLVLKQVENGVFAHMAVLQWVLE